jgi:hypothetical protein
MTDETKGVQAPTPGPLSQIPTDLVADTMNVMARAYERIHSMPRISDTELAIKVGEAKERLRPFLAPPAPVEASVSELHPATVDLVERFAAELKSKLAKAEAKYGYRDEWLKADWQDELTESLAEHIQKGDPRDVAAYCAFAWHHGWSTFDVAGHIAPKFHFQASRERIAKCIRRAVGDAWIGECQAEVAADAILNLHPQPSGETREAVARIVEALDGSKDRGDSSVILSQSDLRALLSARPSPVASGGQHSSGKVETLRVLLDNLVIAQTLSKDLRQKATDEARSYLYELRHAAPVAETAGEAHEARAIRLQAALDAAIAADDGLARAAAAEAQLDRLVDYLAGHLNGLRVGRKEAVDTVIVNLTKLIEAQATTPPVPAQDDDKLRIAVEGIADDYQTSEDHHPDHVLIPKAKFDEIVAALKKGN